MRRTKVALIGFLTLTALMSAPSDAIAEPPEESKQSQVEIFLTAFPQPSFGLLLGAFLEDLTSAIDAIVESIVQLLPPPPIEEVTIDPSVPRVGSTDRPLGCPFDPGPNIPMGWVTLRGSLSLNVVHNMVDDMAGRCGEYEYPGSLTSEQTFQSTGYCHQNEREYPMSGLRVEIIAAPHQTDYPTGKTIHVGYIPESGSIPFAFQVYACNPNTVELNVPLKIKVSATTENNEVVFNVANTQADLENCDGVPFGVQWLRSVGNTTINDFVLAGQNDYFEVVMEAQKIKDDLEETYLYPLDQFVFCRASGIQSKYYQGRRGDGAHFLKLGLGQYNGWVIAREMSKGLIHELTNVFQVSYPERSNDPFGFMPSTQALYEGLSSYFATYVFNRCGDSTSHYRQFSDLDTQARMIGAWETNGHPNHLVDPNRGGANRLGHVTKLLCDIVDYTTDINNQGELERESSSEGSQQFSSSEGSTTGWPHFASDRLALSPRTISEAVQQLPPSEVFPPSYSAGCEFFETFRFTNLARTDYEDLIEVMVLNSILLYGPGC